MNINEYKSFSQRKQFNNFLVTHQAEVCHDKMEARASQRIRSLGRLE